MRLGDTTSHDEQFETAPQLKLLVFHGPSCAPKHELLAWLRGPDLSVDARTVDEMSPHSGGSVDERVNEAIAWADKAIALITPDKRSASGAPNVIEEIARWRARERETDLAIIRDVACGDIWSNLDGVVRVEYTNRVNEGFLKLLRFLGRLPNAMEAASLTLIPVALFEVLQNWKTSTEAHPVPIAIVVGGSDKYDPSRRSLGLKEYQSTEPIVGVVRVARALSDIVGPRFIDATVDYASTFRSTEGEIDVVVVGGGDTNRVTKEIFVQDVSRLPARFEPPTGSDTIVAPLTSDGERWSRPDDGLVLALHRPLRNVRYGVVCAGNGARGTNAALTFLARWLLQPVGTDPVRQKQAAAVVEARESGDPIQLWP